MTDLELMKEVCGQYGLMLFNLKKGMPKGIQKALAKESYPLFQQLEARIKTKENHEAS
jgi:hypothetical protein